MDEHNRILCADTVRRVRGETYKNQDDLYCHRYDTLLSTVVNAVSMGGFSLLHAAGDAETGELPKGTALCIAEAIPEEYSPEELITNTYHEDMLSDLGIDKTGEILDFNFAARSLTVIVWKFSGVDISEWFGIATDLAFRDNPCGQEVRGAPSSGWGFRPRSGMYLLSVYSVFKDHEETYFVPQ